MKKSIRAARMERHHKRQKNTAKLSLVSLMDIFTILVFFLIVNSSTVQVLDSNKSIKLPKAASEQAASENLLLLISQQDVILQGEKIANLADFAASDTTSAQGELKLTSALLLHAQTITPDDAGMRPLTIMADSAVAYSYLKGILQTCQRAGFGDISLAVEQTSGAGEGV